MPRPKEIDVVKRFTVNLDEERAKIIDDLSYSKPEGQKIKGDAAAVRYLIDRFKEDIKQGKIARIKRPANVKRTLPRIQGLCCGSPEELNEAIEHAGRVEITDTSALAWATDHSWVGVAEGWSMHDERYPDSINEGDELLMVPLDEWKRDIPTGTPVLSYVRLRDGSEGCSLKEHMGKTLRARNPNYDNIDFNLLGDVVYGCPLAICVWRLGRCMV